MEQNFKFVKPFIVEVEEVVRKKVVVYAEVEEDAAALAVKTIQQGAVAVVDEPASYTCRSVVDFTPENASRWYPRYGMEVSR